MSTTNEFLRLLKMLEEGGAKVHTFAVPDGACESSQLSAEDVEDLEPENALALSIAAAAGASNRIGAGSFREAIVVQEQSRLWLEIHERLRSEQERASMRESYEQHLAEQAKAEAKAKEATEPEPKTSNGVPYDDAFTQ